jgi:hypothetical protein
MQRVALVAGCAYDSSRQLAHHHAVGALGRWFRSLDTGANVEFKVTQRYFGHMRPSGVAKKPTGNWP